MHSSDCASDIVNGGPAPDGDALCNMPCSGNTGQLCGGPNRLTVFEYNGDLPTTPTPGGGGNAGEGNGGNVSPVTEGLPDSWTYNGCWMYVFL